MGTGRAYGRREQAAGASALVLFIGALYILGVFTPTTPLPGEPRSTSICDVARPAGPIIGTFTTTPVRIGELKGTIRALLEDQSMPLDELILNVPQRSMRFNTTYDLPDSLHELAQPRLTVLRGSDYGPATKLIPTLQLLEQRGTQNATLLVVDDDTDYSPSLVCEYVKASHRHPGAALGYRGLYFNYRSKLCNGTQTLPAGYLSNGGTSPKGEDHDVDVLTVVGSLFVRADAFDSHTWDYTACRNETVQGLFFNDDIWFNGHLARKGVRRVRLGWMLNESGWKTGYRLGHQVRRKGGLKQGANAAWGTFGDRSVWAFAEDFMRTLCTVEHVGTSFADMCHFDPRRKAAARRMLADEGVEW